MYIFFSSSSLKQNYISLSFSWYSAPNCDRSSSFLSAPCNDSVTSQFMLVLTCNFMLKKIKPLIMRLKSYIFISVLFFSFCRLGAEIFEVDYFRLELVLGRLLRGQNSGRSVVNNLSWLSLNNIFLQILVIFPVEDNSYFFHLIWNSLRYIMNTDLV